MVLENLTSAGLWGVIRICMHTSASDCIEVNKTNVN
jgi:hypothetical protein